MLLHTPLFDVHRELGARFVEFGGWEMPLHYGSQISEHHAVRRGAGMFDVSHMQELDLRGAGSRDFLRYCLANNIDKLSAPGKALYSCMLNDRGGVVDDLIVYFLAPAHFRMVVNAAFAQRDLEWLDAIRSRRGFEAAIIPCTDTAMISVQGPEARRAVWSALPGARAEIESLPVFAGTHIDHCFVARTGYTGEDGLELSLPSEHAPELWQRIMACGVAVCGLGARDTLRLEAGLNLNGQDMDETVTPFEAGLGWTVDLKTDREFAGRAALERHPPSSQLVGLLLQSPGVLRSHQLVRTAQGRGEITSGTFSPTIGKAIALARVPAGARIGEIVEVDLRGKAVQCRVVKHPFVRNNKILV